MHGRGQRTCTYGRSHARLHVHMRVCSGTLADVIDSPRWRDEVDDDPKLRSPDNADEVDQRHLHFGLFTDAFQVRGVVAFHIPALTPPSPRACPADGHPIDPAPAPLHAAMPR